MSATMEMVAPKATRKTLVHILKQEAVEDKAFKVFSDDRFGCDLIVRGALGIPAQINSALSSTPKTAAQIATETGATEKRVLEHLNYWKKAKRGIGLFLLETPEGWLLVA